MHVQRYDGSERLLDWRLHPHPPIPPRLFSPFFFLSVIAGHSTTISIMVEIEEASTGADEMSPLLSNPKTDPIPSTRTKSVKTKVPEIKVHLYKQGKGPIDEFTSSLGGFEQDQLEVRDILDKYGFKSVYAFKPETGRGVPIRFNPRNGRSILTYRDGSEIHIDGEPKVQSSHTIPN